MPDKSTNGRAESKLPPMMMPFGLDALMEFHRPTLNAMAQVNDRVYDGIAAMNKQWVSFLNRRLKEELAVPQQLAACKTVQEMYGVCADFLQTAYADYQSEFEQMTKLGKSLADDTLHAMQKRVEDMAAESRPTH
ncbi:MAG TPA: phasin family protein [Hyphomicrobiaceae bacterium]|jgi:hypothetical protein|nr:phasin family protein [Hyphomicrobiaceae bacterium]